MHFTAAQEVTLKYECNSSCIESGATSLYRPGLSTRRALCSLGWTALSIAVGYSRKAGAIRTGNTVIGGTYSPLVRWETYPGMLHHDKRVFGVYLYICRNSLRRGFALAHWRRSTKAKAKCGDFSPFGITAFRSIRNRHPS